VPIENTSDGKLANFYSIIDRYELKIWSTCEIESSDGDQVTRYALLTRRLIIPNSDHCYVEFSFVSTQANTLRNIIEISSLLELSVHRIDSLPLRYNKSSFEISSVLYGTLDNILKFILFVKLNIPQHTVLGLYNNV
jgi:prephenate dehydratase